MGAPWGVSSSIFHGFSPFRSAASHTRLTGPFCFISEHLSQTRRARGLGRLLQEAAAARVRGDTHAHWFFIVCFQLFTSDCPADLGAALLVFSGRLCLEGETRLWKKSSFGAVYFPCDVI